MSLNSVKNLQTTKFIQPTSAEKLAIKQISEPEPNLHYWPFVWPNSSVVCWFAASVWRWFGSLVCYLPELKVNFDYQEIEQANKLPG